MTEKIFFSIIIPCFNIGPSFANLLKSLEGQTFKNFEVIFVDDTASPERQHHLRQLLSKSSFNFTIHINKKNVGPGLSRNVGIKSSRGEFICFLDDDDCWKEEKLARCYEIIQQYGPNILGHYMEGHFSPSHLLPKNFYIKDFLISNRVTTSALTVKREYVIPFSKQRYSEDLDFILHLLEENSILMIPEKLGSIGRSINSPGGQSSNLGEMRFGELIAYMNYMKRKPRRYLLLIFLVIYSFLKHLRKVISH